MKLKLFVFWLLTYSAFAIEKVDLKFFSGTKLTKYNVIEFFSEECPFSQRQYDFLNMQFNQDFFLKHKFNWFLINLSKNKLNINTNHFFSHLKNQSNENFIIIENKGFDIAKELQVKVTPTVFLFDQKGKIIFSGAVEDSDPFSKLEVKKVNNYLISAIQEINGKKEITFKHIKSIGCPIKYP